MFDGRNGGKGEAGFVTRADLVRNLGLVGAAYSFAHSAPADEPVLEGRFDTLRLRPGLVLHTACVRDLRTMHTSNRLHPGVKIVLLVDGATDLSFGRHRFRLGPATEDPRERDAGALVNLAEEDQFARRWQAGRSERKVSLTLTREWLEEGGFCEHGAHRSLERFCREHMARQPWTPTPRARALARQILAPQALDPGMARLRLESRCIELAAEALAAIGTGTDVANGASLRPAELRRLARLDELLRAMPAETPSVAEIARLVGTNPVSLQALSGRAWGCTVFERLRALRMERADELLLAGASVGAAAEAAGFSTAANFSTAYKRRYGISPRERRA